MILLLLFDTLRTVAPRLSIKMTAVATILNTLKLMCRYASKAADGAIRDAIVTPHLSRPSDWPRNVIAFLFGHTTFAWVTDRGAEERIFRPGKLNIKTGAPRRLYFGFSILVVFSS